MWVIEQEQFLKRVFTVFNEVPAHILRMQLIAFKNLDCQSWQFGKKKNDTHTTSFDYHHVLVIDDDTNKNDVVGKRREASNKTEQKQI